MPSNTILLCFSLNLRTVCELIVRGFHGGLLDQKSTIHLPQTVGLRLDHVEHFLPEARASLFA